MNIVTENSYHFENGCFIHPKDVRALMQVKKLSDSSDIDDDEEAASLMLWKRNTKQALRLLVDI